MAGNMLAGTPAGHAKLTICLREYYLLCKELGFEPDPSTVKELEQEANCVANNCSATKERSLDCKEGKDDLDDPTTSLDDWKGHNFFVVCMLKIKADIDDGKLINTMIDPANGLDKKCLEPYVFNLTPLPNPCVNHNNKILECAADNLPIDIYDWQTFNARFACQREANDFYRDYNCVANIPDNHTDPCLPNTAAWTKCMSDELSSTKPAHISRRERIACHKVVLASDPPRCHRPPLPSSLDDPCADFDLEAEQYRAEYHVTDMTWRDSNTYRSKLLRLQEYYSDYDCQVEIPDLEADPCGAFESQWMICSMTYMGYTNVVKHWDKFNLKFDCWRKANAAAKAVCRKPCREDYDDPCTGHDTEITACMQTYRDSAQKWTHKNAKRTCVITINLKYADKYCYEPVPEVAPDPCVNHESMITVCRTQFINTKDSILEWIRLNTMRNCILAANDIFTESDCSTSPPPHTMNPCIEFEGLWQKCTEAFNVAVAAEEKWNKDNPDKRPKYNEWKFHNVKVTCETDLLNDYTAYECKGTAESPKDDPCIPFKSNIVDCKKLFDKDSNTKNKWNHFNAMVDCIRLNNMNFLTRGCYEDVPEKKDNPCAEHEAEVDICDAAFLHSADKRYWFKNNARKLCIDQANTKHSGSNCHSNPGSEMTDPCKPHSNGIAACDNAFTANIDDLEGWENYNKQNACYRRWNAVYVSLGCTKTPGPDKLDPCATFKLDRKECQETYDNSPSTKEWIRFNAQNICYKRANDSHEGCKIDPPADLPDLCKNQEEAWMDCDEMYGEGPGAEWIRYNARNMCYEHANTLTSKDYCRQTVPEDKPDPCKQHKSEVRNCHLAYNDAIKKPDVKEWESWNEMNKCVKDTNTRHLLIGCHIDPGKDKLDPCIPHQKAWDQCDYNYDNLDKEMKGWMRYNKRIVCHEKANTDHAGEHCFRTPFTKLQDPCKPFYIFVKQCDDQYPKDADKIPKWQRFNNQNECKQRAIDAYAEDECTTKVYPPQTDPCIPFRDDRDDCRTAFENSSLPLWIKTNNRYECESDANDTYMKDGCYVPVPNDEPNPCTFFLEEVEVCRTKFPVSGPNDWEGNNALAGCLVGVKNYWDEHKPEAKCSCVIPPITNDPCKDYDTARLTCQNIFKNSNAEPWIAVNNQNDCYRTACEKEIKKTCCKAIPFDEDDPCEDFNNYWDICDLVYDAAPEPLWVRHNLRNRCYSDANEDHGEGTKCSKQVPDKKIDPCGKHLLEIKTCNSTYSAKMLNDSDKDHILWNDRNDCYETANTKWSDNDCSHIVPKDEDDPCETFNNAVHECNLNFVRAFSAQLWVKTNAKVDCYTLAKNTHGSHHECKIDIPDKMDDPCEAHTNAITICDKTYSDAVVGDQNIKVNKWAYNNAKRKCVMTANFKHGENGCYRTAPKSMRDPCEYHKESVANCLHDFQFSTEPLAWKKTNKKNACIRKLNTEWEHLPCVHHVGEDDPNPCAPVDAAYEICLEKYEDGLTKYKNKSAGFEEPWELHNKKRACIIIANDRTSSAECKKHVEDILPDPCAGFDSGWADCRADYIKNAAKPEWDKHNIRYECYELTNQEFPICAEDPGSKMDVPVIPPTECSVEMDGEFQITLRTCDQKFSACHAVLVICKDLALKKYRPCKLPVKQEWCYVTEFEVKTIIVKKTKRYRCAAIVDNSGNLNSANPACTITMQENLGKKFNECQSEWMLRKEFSSVSESENYKIRDICFDDGNKAFAPCNRSKPFPPVTGSGHCSSCCAKCWDYTTMDTDMYNKQTGIYITNITKEKSYTLYQLLINDYFSFCHTYSKFHPGSSCSAAPQFSGTMTAENKKQYEEFGSTHGFFANQDINGELVSHTVSVDRTHGSSSRNHSTIIHGSGVETGTNGETNIHGTTDQNGHNIGGYTNVTTDRTEGGVTQPLILGGNGITSATDPGVVCFTKSSPEGIRIMALNMDFSQAAARYAGANGEYYRRCDSYLALIHGCVSQTEYNGIIVDYKGYCVAYEATHSGCQRPAIPAYQAP